MRAYSARTPRAAPAKAARPRGVRYGGQVRPGRPSGLRLTTGGTMATTPAEPTYTAILSVGLLGTISNILAKADTFYRCSVCRSLTDDQAAHTAWHMATMPQAVSCSICLLRVLPADLASHVLFAHGNTPGAMTPTL